MQPRPVAFAGLCNLGGWGVGVQPAQTSACRKGWACSAPASEAGRGRVRSGRKAAGQHRVAWVARCSLTSCGHGQGDVAVSERPVCLQERVHLTFAITGNHWSVREQTSAARLQGAFRCRAASARDAPARRGRGAKEYPREAAAYELVRQVGKGAGGLVRAPPWRPSRHTLSLKQFALLCKPPLCSACAHADFTAALCS